LENSFENCGLSEGEFFIKKRALFKKKWNAIFAVKVNSFCFELKVRPSGFMKLFASTVWRFAGLILPF
jgi:hypothetical protein